MLSNHAVGLDGESQALEHLLAQGYTLIMQRYRNRYGEIDLVMQQGDTIHFIEVKTRPSLGQGFDALSRKQQQRIWNCALAFVADYPRYEGYAMQIDLMIITGSQLHHEMNILSAD